MVAQLNTYFKANEPFNAQGWIAKLNDDNTIDLLFKFTDWRQASYNTGKAGFSLSANLLPEWIATSAMLRMNGQRSGGGAITNWASALTYFRNDIAQTTHNPDKDVTSVKIAYPICLPGYLGTSQYQSDHCSYLRSVSGEGEEGWLKFMASLLPGRPTEYGSNGDKAKYGDAKKNTYYLASAKYVDVDGNTQPVSPAADFVASISFDYDLLF